MQTPLILSSSEVQRIKRDFLAYARTAEGRTSLATVLHAEEQVGFLMGWIAALIGACMPGIGLSNALAVRRMLKEGRRVLEGFDRFLASAQPVLCQVHMYNTSLRAGGEPVVAPVGGVIAFNPASAKYLASEAFSDHLDMLQLGGTDGSAEQHRAAQILADERYQGAVRTPLPTAAFENHEVLAVGVNTRSDWFADGRVPAAFWVLAVPGPSGLCVQIPAWIVSGRANEPIELEPPRPSSRK